MRHAHFVHATLTALALAAPAAAQEPTELGSGMKFTGVPTMQEIIAQQKACELRRVPRKTSGALNEGLYRRLERIMDLISKNEYVEAEAKLKELDMDRASGYEQAIILQTLGFVYNATKRDPQALKAFEQAVATNSLPQQQHEQLMLNVAHLYIVSDKLDQGMAKLNAYLAETCNPNPDAHIMLANVHAEKKQWREALRQVDLAVVKSRAPKESWLQVKLALHYELKEYPRCAEVLVYLIALNPIKAEYFKQLSGMLLEIQKDPEALAVMALAERRGFIDEEHEYRNLAALYMGMNIPLKAAMALERGLAQKQVAATEKNFDMLASAWTVARDLDKAESAMARAAKVSDKGEMYKRLAEIQIEGENWKAALESLQKAQKKGGLKDPGHAAYLVGVAAVNLKQWKTAEAALKQAMVYEKWTKIATDWLAHLRAELAFSQATENGAEQQTN
jgi:hypothetical protein